MIPWFSFETYSLFGLTFRVWGTIVALGIAASLWVARTRAKKLGLDVTKIWDLSFWVIVSALVGSRLFHVFFYDWPHFAAHPLDIINPTLPGYAMFGAWLGGAIALFAVIRNYHLKFLAYADVLVFSLPLGIGIGRIGCFFLGVRYPDGLVRHDLGLYLSLIGFATAGLFFLIDRASRSKRLATCNLPLATCCPGFWLGLFMLIEGVTRFSLDFLRIADARWFNLTPAQWLSLPLAVGGVIVILFSHRTLYARFKKTSVP